MRGLGSSPVSGALHEEHSSGRTTFTSSTPSGGAGFRVLPSWPGWAPRFLPLFGFFDGVCFFQGPSLEGGLLDVLEVLGLRASRRSIFAPCFSITAWSSASFFACSTQPRHSESSVWGALDTASGIGRLAIKLARYRRSVSAGRPRPTILKLIQGQSVTRSALKTRGATGFRVECG